MNLYEFTHTATMIRCTIDLLNCQRLSVIYGDNVIKHLRGFKKYVYSYEGNCYSYLVGTDCVYLTLYENSRPKVEEFLINGKPVNRYEFMKRISRIE